MPALIPTPEDLARVADGQSVRRVPHGTGSEGRWRRPSAGLILGSVLVLACIAGMFLLRSRKAVLEGAQRVPGSFAVPDAGATQPSRNPWRAKALRELDEGHDAEALLWLAEHAREASSGNCRSRSRPWTAALDCSRRRSVQTDVAWRRRIARA